jgi:carbamoyltransferase
MIILGVAGLFHDAAAALVRDGELVAFVEEERLIRQKHAYGQFPHHAIRFCLQQAGISFKEVDYLAFYYDVPRSLLYDWRVEPFFSHFSRYPRDLFGYVENLQMIKAYLESFAEAAGVKLEVIDHHDCHLAAAFFLSPFQQANLLSLDARGEVVTAVLAKGEGTTITRLGEVPMPHSLGMLYSAVTQFLGFTPLDGEGSVMGLASYGEDRFADAFAQIIVPTADGFVTRPELYWSHATVGWLSHVPNGLTRFFGEPRPYRKNPIDGTDEHIAASLQCATEQIGSHLVTLLHKETGWRDFCLTGGVALNAKMNGALLSHPAVDSLYVPPVSNDPGCAIGAAYLLHARLTGQRPRAIPHAYYGPHFSNDEIKAVLDETGMKYTDCDDIATYGAGRLAEGKILGWFQGRMEMGPRALGNRSILAHPGGAAMKDLVNNKVKHREPWRPFGPSVVSEWRERYFPGGPEAPFMTKALNTTEAGRRDLAAAVHVDGTARAQTVTEKANPLYYSLIREFGKATGVYGVLNTSFNLKGQPIVNTPREAVAMFQQTGMDYLLIGDFVVRR